MKAVYARLNGILDQWDSPYEIFPVLGMLLATYLCFHGKLSGTEWTASVAALAACFHAGGALASANKD